MNTKKFFDDLYWISHNSSNAISCYDAFYLEAEYGQIIKEIQGHFVKRNRK